MHNTSHPPMDHWMGVGARWGLAVGALIGILLGGGIAIGIGITLGGILGFAAGALADRRRQPHDH